MGQQHMSTITNASAQCISLYLLFTNILAIYAPMIYTKAGHKIVISLTVTFNR